MCFDCEYKNTENDTMARILFPLRCVSVAAHASVRVRMIDQSLGKNWAEPGN